MEGSQYGFQAHRAVQNLLQMVVQRARYWQQQAMKNCGTLIRIKLDLKNDLQVIPASGQFCKA